MSNNVPIEARLQPLSLDCMISFHFHPALETTAFIGDGFQVAAVDSKQWYEYISTERTGWCFYSGTSYLIQVHIYIVFFDI